MVQYMHKHYYIFFSHIWTSILKIHKNYLFSTSLTVIKGKVLKSICCFSETSFFRYTLTVFGNLVYSFCVFLCWDFIYTFFEMYLFWTINCPFGIYLFWEKSLIRLLFVGTSLYRLVFIFISVPHARFSVENY